MAAIEKTAFIFPGQGAQAVGMGRDIYDAFPSAKGIIDRADEVLSFPLSRLMFEGPEEELRQTVNAQPALVTVSHALLTVLLESQGDNLPAPVYAAGHSLGEYTALIAAGVLDFETTVFLARERGRLMHEAGQLQAGAMAAVLGLDEPPLLEICEQTGTVIANYNSPGQLVISGPAADIPKASEMALAKGASRVVPLQVSGAFHSPLMRPAQENLSRIIEGINFKEPQVPIVGNTTASPLTTADAIKQELNEQLCSPVQWQRSIEFMVGQRVSVFYEIGPGKVLSGLNRRISKEITTLNINDAETVANPAA